MPTFMRFTHIFIPTFAAKVHIFLYYALLFSNKM